MIYVFNQAIPQHCSDILPSLAMDDTQADYTPNVPTHMQDVVMVQLKDIIDTMVDEHSQFAKEVPRIL